MISNGTAPLLEYPEGMEDNTESGFYAASFNAVEFGGVTY